MRLHTSREGARRTQRQRPVRADRRSHQSRKGRSRGRRAAYCTATGRVKARRPAGALSAGLLLACAASSLHLPPNPTRTATRQELSDFLAAAERRAFKQAVYAVRDQEVALDVVQDAMLAHHPLRRAPAVGTAAAVPADPRTRSPTTSGARRSATSDDAAVDAGRRRRGRGRRARHPRALEPEPAAPPRPTGPIDSSAPSCYHPDEEIGKLPRRQREAFLLRYWEDLNVAETAEAMDARRAASRRTVPVRPTPADVLRARGIAP